MTYSGTELTPRLVELYRQMDEAYSKASQMTGFSCEGCNGIKCCTVDLIVHTFTEMLQLRRGLKVLDEVMRLEIKTRARNILKAKAEDPLGTEYREAVCALNFDGKCVLYEHRPMICRLAGIPHLIKRPNESQISSGGCFRYETDKRPAFPDVVIDRTLFYREMAELEIAVIRELGHRTRSLTIAEILGGCL